MNPKLEVFLVDVEKCIKFLNNGSAMKYLDESYWLHSSTLKENSPIIGRRDR